MKYQDFKRMLKVTDGNIEDFEAIFNQVEQEARDGYISKVDSQKEIDLINKTHKLELQGVKQGFALDSELDKVNTHDKALLKSLLDLKKLKFGEGGVEGLDEQIKTLKESKPYLFKPEEAKVDHEPHQSFNFTGATPAGNASNPGASTIDDEQAILNAMLSSSVF